MVVVVVAAGSAYVVVAAVGVLMMMVVSAAVVAAALECDVRKDDVAVAVVLGLYVEGAAAVVVLKSDAACSVDAGVVALVVGIEAGSAGCRPVDTAAAAVCLKLKAPVASPSPRSSDPIDI